MISMSLRLRFGSVETVGAAAKPVKLLRSGATKLPQHMDTVGKARQGRLGLHEASIEGASAMNTDAIRRSDLAALARDPLVRLVMDSDGVTEAEFVAVLLNAQRAVQARTATGRHCEVAPRRRRGALRAVPASSGLGAGL
jgi:hypothetical protein